MSVFISYSKKDLTAAERVTRGFQAADIPYWRDQDSIQAGTYWSEEIMKGIREATVVVLLFSKNSNESTPVLREMEHAARLKKPIIPFRLDDTEMNDGLLYHVSSHQWISAENPPTTSSVSRLVDAVSALIDNSSTSNDSISTSEKRVPSVSRNVLTGTARFSRPKLRHFGWRKIGVAVSVVSVALIVFIAVLGRSQPDSPDEVVEEAAAGQAGTVTDPDVTADSEGYETDTNMEEHVEPETNVVENNAASGSAGGGRDPHTTTTTTVETTPALPTENLLTLAVLYFDNGSQDTELDPLRKGMADMLITQMSPFARVIERAKLEEILKELDLSNSADFDPETAQEIGRLLGAEYLISGSFFELFGSLRIDARIIRVETGEIMSSKGVDGEVSQFMELHDRLSESLLADMPQSVQRESAQQSQLIADDMISYESVLAYSRALDLVDAGSVDAAKEALEGVISADPDFYQAKSLLESL